MFWLYLEKEMAEVRGLYMCIGGHLLERCVYCVPTPVCVFSTGIAAFTVQLVQSVTIYVVLIELKIS